MRLRDQSLIPAALPAPAPLPSLTSAFSRRTAIFGALSATGFAPVIGAAAAMMVPPPAEAFARAADAHLAALVDELETGAVALVALAKGDPRDCEEIPGYSAAEARLSAIVADLHEVRAQGMAGVVAMARALTVRFVADDYQTTGDLAWNLAEDILQLQAEGRLS